MSKEWSVTLPVVGTVIVFVEANTAEDAIEKALETADFRVIGTDDTEPGEGWAAVRSIRRGNTMMVDAPDAEAVPA